MNSRRIALVAVLAGLAVALPTATAKQRPAPPPAPTGCYDIVDVPAQGEVPGRTSTAQSHAVLEEATLAHDATRVEEPVYVKKTYFSDLSRVVATTELAAAPCPTASYGVLTYREGASIGESAPPYRAAWAPGSGDTSAMTFSMLVGELADACVEVRLATRDAAGTVVDVAPEWDVPGIAVCRAVGSGAQGFGG